MDMLNTLIGKITGWIDQLFGFFGIYTKNYSKILVYILLAYVVGKFLFKGKLNVNVGGGK